MLLKRGERGIIIGQTGSGKTVGAIWHMQHTQQTPVVIMDTKGEPAFDKIALDEETVQVYDSLVDFEKAWFKSGRQPVYSIVRPDPHEIADPAGMDETLVKLLYGRACFLYIDECYQWHTQGRAGAGLTGVLTRGRSKGITTLLSTQRPAWISRFCFSECQKMYIYRLTDRRDKKTISEFIPDFEDKYLTGKHYWWYYDVMDSKLAQFLPVEILKNKTPDTPTQVGRVWF